MGQIAAPAPTAPSWVEKAADNVRTHLPYYVGAALVIVNGLVDAGYVTLPESTTGLVNAILAALGLGVLHNRQQKG